MREVPFVTPRKARPRLPLARSSQRKGTTGGHRRAGYGHWHIGSFEQQRGVQAETTINDKGAYNFLVTPHPMPNIVA